MEERLELLEVGMVKVIYLVTYHVKGKKHLETLHALFALSVGVTTE